MSWEPDKIPSFMFFSEEEERGVIITSQGFWISATSLLCVLICASIRFSQAAFVAEPRCLRLSEEHNRQTERETHSFLPLDTMRPR